MKINKQKVFALALAVCLIATLSMGSLAWFTDDDSVTNDFFIAGSEDENPDDVFSVDVWEDATPEDPDGEDKIQDGIEYPAILPGDDLYKEVNVENTGAYAQYIRTTVTVTDAHIWQAIYGEVYVPLNEIATDLNDDFVTWSIEYNAQEDTLTYVLYYKNILAVDEVVTLFTNVAIPEEMTREQAAEMAGGFQINVVAEAVQTENVGDNAAEAFETVGMAVPAGNITSGVTAANLQDVLATGADLVILDASEDWSNLVIDYDVANVTIDANGAAAAISFTALVDNVTVTNIVDTEAGEKASINVKGAAAGSSLTVKDSYMVSTKGTGAAAVLPGANCELTIENCEIVSGTGKNYGVYCSGAVAGLTITDTTFTGFTSWAVQINNAVNGDLLIDSCVFNTPDGVLKVLSGVNGNFTFTNNTLIGCQGHDGKPEQMLVSTSKNVPVTATGTITFENNTLDGVEYDIYN